MSNTAQQKKKKPTHVGSTQKFTQVHDIIDDVVVLDGGNACLLIEVQASNFALLSQDEQNARIFAYASFLNSLSFPVQIVIQSTKIDISSYLRLLDSHMQQPTLHSSLSEQQNQALITQIKLYKDFIAELVKVNTVLDKKFYIVVPYSYLEKGIGGAATVAQGKKGHANFVEQAKTTLHTKANAVLGQLARLSLRSKVLEKEELIKVYYDMYNQQRSTPEQLSAGIHTPVIMTP